MPVSFLGGVYQFRPVTDLPLAGLWARLKFRAPSVKIKVCDVSKPHGVGPWGLLKGPCWVYEQSHGGGLGGETHRGSWVTAFYKAQNGSRQHSLLTPFYYFFGFVVVVFDVLILAPLDLGPWA